MDQNQETWEDLHVVKIRGQELSTFATEEDISIPPDEIEPWLTTLLQSEHLSLLLGSGFPTAAHFIATGTTGADMSCMEFTRFTEQISRASLESAKKSGRGAPNIEDQIRVCNELIKGLEIYLIGNPYGSKKIIKNLNIVKNELNNGLKNFANNLLAAESNIINSDGSQIAAKYLIDFLISFSSRPATKERLNIFTTNYDRIIEYAAELAGIRLIDRFVGNVNPIFRASRVMVDMHYNPPGIRGEPRYLEGVVQYCKLHGSIDWSMTENVIRRFALPYGVKSVESFVHEAQSMMIYPNSSKDRETAEYPYVELFRDFATHLCQPNSTILIYGYSFGDEHINRVLIDMLTIPSTHIVIVSFDDPGNRIHKFYHETKRPSQISLLIGSNFANLGNLTDKYLSKPAIDKAEIRMAELLKSRGFPVSNTDPVGEQE